MYLVQLIYQVLHLREIQVSKHSYDVEAKEYAKSPQTVKDWDENILADISHPVEARLVKDATMAIKQPDENNLELDAINDIDIVLANWYIIHKWF